MMVITNLINKKVIIYLVGGSSVSGTLLKRSDYWFEVMKTIAGKETNVAVNVSNILYIHET